MVPFVSLPVQSLLIREQMGMRGKNRSKGADRRKIRSRYEESDLSDDDYKIEDDGESEDSEEYCSSLAEEELEDDIVEDEEEEMVKVNGKVKRRNSFPTKSRGRVGKMCKDRKVSYKEDIDEDYVDGDDDVDEEEVAKDWRTGFPKRKRNGAQKAVKEKKASHMEENDDDCEAEDDDCDDDDDEDYNAKEDNGDLWKRFPRRKRNGVQKADRKKKAANMEKNNDDYETENDERDEDDDYDNKDEKDLRKGCPSTHQNGAQELVKKKKVSYTEESDDDYEAEDDECDDEDDYENEEVEEEYDNDEDFTSDEIDFDDEDELVVKKTMKVRRAPSQGRRLSRGGKGRKNSRVINKSKRKKPTKTHGFQRKLCSDRRRETTTGKSTVKETKVSNSGSKRRRLMLDSDSDFAISEPLSEDEEYTISEEEREQVREANRFCGHLNVTLRISSSKKKPRKEGNLQQEKRCKVRKGKDKVDNSKKAATKQVCGICFSEEGKRTVRGTLDCCSHYFCFNCIMEWSKVESRCPLCKQRFASVSKPGRSDSVSDLRTIVVPVPERDQVYQPSEEELRAYLDPYENVICTECHHGGDDANMLLCDLCDSPAHTYCVGLNEVPEGNWYCEGCRPTALGPSNPESTTFTCDRRTSNDLSAGSSPPQNGREAIDLNRVYEPETPLADGTEMFSSPRRADGGFRSGSSIPGVGVQTVRERRRRHQQFAQLVGRTGSNVQLGPEVEWGRTRRFGFANATRTNASSYHTTFPQGLSHENFASPVPRMHHMPAIPSHSGVLRVWGQTFTGVTGSADGSGSLPAGLAGIRSGDAGSIHGHSSMQ